MHLLRLPEELLIHITSMTTFLDIVHLRAVCKLWARTIDESPLLQYITELGISGQTERTGVSAHLTVEDRVKRLRDELAVWTKGRLLRVGLVKNSSRSIVKAALISDGILAASHPRRDPAPEGVDPRHIIYISVPNTHSNHSSEPHAPFKSWMLVLEGGILVADPAQNLILSRCGEMHDGAGVVCTALTLSSGVSHPRCTAPNAMLYVPDPTKAITYQAHYTRFSIVEGTLLVTFANIQRCASVFMDWSTGVVKSSFAPPPLITGLQYGYISTPTLLSARSFLYPTYDVQTQTPSIELYALHPSDAVGPTLLRRFDLPRLHQVPVACVTLSPFPRNRAMPQPLTVSNPPSPFESDPMSSMMEVSLRMWHQPEHTIDGSPQDIQFYTPLSPFLTEVSTAQTSSILPSEPGIVRWTDWGPERTRWINGTESDSDERADMGPNAGPDGGRAHGRTTTFPTHRDGSRLLMPGRLLDFAPFAVKHVMHRRPRESSPKCELGEFRLVTEPTITRHHLLHENVVSKLPYFERELDCPALEEADDFLLIGDTVVLINAGYEELEVYNMRES